MGFARTTDIEIEQELSRPYVYASLKWKPSGFDVISVKDPGKAQIIYRWRIEDPSIHEGWGADDGKYFKLNGRYYYVQAVAFRRSGPDHDLGAIVFDVTGLPDTTTIREVGRIRTPDTPGGFHNVFMYKHSDRRALLFATVRAPPTAPHGANIYDMGAFLSGAPSHGLVGRVPLPEPRGAADGYHDMFVGYDPSTHQDKFYGGGPEVTPLGGNYVYDVSDPSSPVLLASVMGFPGQHGTHTFVPTPDGRYALTRSGGEYQPLRVFDLKPALDGEIKNVNRPIGAWIANWEHKAHNMEVRWPYVFVSNYEDGLQVFNMMDPTNLYTVGYYDTFDGPHGSRSPGRSTGGAWGIDVRNADGLIVIGDGTFGFWALEMDGFDGWNGHQWGMPDVSSAQDWDNGPDGAPQPARVSALE